MRRGVMLTWWRPAFAQATGSIKSPARKRRIYHAIGPLSICGTAPCGLHRAYSRRLVIQRSSAIINPPQAAQAALQAVVAAAGAAANREGEACTANVPPMLRQT